MKEPSIGKDEYQNKITELAKKGIEQRLVQMGEVIESDNARLVTEAITTANESDPVDQLIEDYPRAVREYASNEANSWWSNSGDVVDGQSPLDAAREIERQVVEKEVQERAKKLLDSSWEARNVLRVKRTRAD